MQVRGAMINQLPLRAADQVAWATERLTFGNLAPYGIPRPPLGAATQLKHNQQSPACDAGFLSALRAGRITVVAAGDGFEVDDIDSPSGPVRRLTLSLLRPATVAGSPPSWALWVCSMIGRHRSSTAARSTRTHPASSSPVIAPTCRASCA